MHLYNSLQAGFSKFTLNPRPHHDRVLQRVNYARSKAPTLIDELADVYVKSGRMLKLWKEIAAVRRLVIENYNALQPLIQMKYWRDVISKLPIGDLFTTVLDTDLRNGIGHHSAHYEPETDEIVVYDTKLGATVARTIRYTDFCNSILKLFAAFELAAMYHHSLHLHVDGRLS